MIYFLHMLNFLPNGTFTDSFLEFERIFLYSFFLHDWGLQMASWSPEIPDLGPRSRVAPGFRAAPGSLPGLGLRSRVAPGFGPPLPGRSRVLGLAPGSLPALGLPFGPHPWPWPRILDLARILDFFSVLVAILRTCGWKHTNVIRFQSYVVLMQ